MFAKLATHDDNRSPYRPGRDGLAWSALPHAPVIAHRPSRARVLRRGVATALRRVADLLYGRRRVGRLLDPPVGVKG